MKIEKKGYSRSPWRLTGDGGKEYEVCDPVSGIVMPVCADTKSGVVEIVLRLFAAKLDAEKTALAQQANKEQPPNA